MRRDRRFYVVETLLTEPEFLALTAEAMLTPGGTLGEALRVRADMPAKAYGSGLLPDDVTHPGEYTAPDGSTLTVTSERELR